MPSVGVCRRVAGAPNKWRTSESHFRMDLRIVHSRCNPVLGNPEEQQWRRYDRLVQATASVCIRTWGCKHKCNNNVRIFHLAEQWDVAWKFRLEHGEWYWVTFNKVVRLD